MKWPWRRGRHCLKRRQQWQWVPVAPEELEAITEPMEKVVEDRNNEYSDFYYDDKYYEELRNQEFLNTFFMGDSDGAERVVSRRATSEASHRKL